MEVTIEQVSFSEVLPLNNAYSKEGLTLYDEEGTTWLGARHQGQLVGISAYQQTPYGVMFRSIFVLEGYRTLGIFKQLFSEMMKKIEPQKPKKIYAFCTKNSLHTFIKNGFSIKGTFKKKYIHVELNDPFRKVKMDFTEFCNVIKGTVVSGPKNIKIYNFSNTIKGVKSSGTVVLPYLKQRKLRQRRLRHFSNCVVVFERGQRIKRFLPNVCYIRVENITTAYWNFVQYYRSKHDIPVFAITGTCGKTTVKDMISHILKSRHNVVHTIKNNNTPSKNFGYLCKITEDTDMAVYETPVDGPKLIEYNCKYFQPTIGMITNIGIDHLRYCGTVENYIKAKGSIIKGLGYKGTLILNADDENTKKIDLEKFQGKLIYVGLNELADYYASDITFAMNGMEFILHHQNRQYKAFVPGYGEHQVYNALSAISGVHQVGFEISEAIEKLKDFKNMRSHLETFTGHNGSMIVDDTWNSNPTSIESAIKTFSKISEDKKKIAVIGSISWLGEEAESIHKKVGEMISNYEIDVLIPYGDFASEIAEGAKELKTEVFVCNSIEQLKSKLLPLLNENTSLLLKTSMKDETFKPLLSLLKNNSN